MGAQYVEEAAESCAALLRTVVDEDWENTDAAGLEWSCRFTATHVASDFLGYAGNLASRAQTSYVPFDITVDGDEKGNYRADNAGLIDVVTTTGALFAATLRTAPRAARAYHPYPFRSANRDGFAAMGIAEALLHTHDIAQGFGVPYEAPAELAEYVLTTIFPGVRPGPAPWPTLLWATGRGELPGRARVTEWRWCNNLVLPTERLTLEGVTPAAAADLAAGGDGGFDWVADGPFEGTRAAAGMMLKAYESGVHRPEFGVFALVRREDDRAIGGIGFHGAPDEDGRAEVGYDLAESARGQGYATEALRALSAWALDRDDVRLLMATVEETNHASQAVVTRAGYVRATIEEQREVHAQEQHEPLEKEADLRLYLRGRD
ncbi:GNAT family N-acetyltransferase [Streptomyces sp. Act143]|uniref:GNAT family N-acetyltransferase n=1 Tax=Streptomyces sp. Act143 TaxID=2200760 RepID=UPI000D68355E|nr:GNAT family N-acetyltransferase [Streptomyces sp. Act143]PWI16359.1 GNAT family N-acetyltransferase [Streptomyces sp. Act143]